MSNYYLDIIIISNETNVLIDHVDDLIERKLIFSSSRNIRFIFVLSKHIIIEQINFEKIDFAEYTLVCELYSGIYGAMNAGIFAAEADFIHFNNSGDRLLFIPDDLEPDKMNYYAVDIIDMNGKSVTRDPGDRRYLMPHHQGTFIPRALYQENYFNEGYNLAADLDFYLRTKSTSDVRHKVTISKFFTGGASTLSTNRWKRICERTKIIYNNKYIMCYLKYILVKIFILGKRN